MNINDIIKWLRENGNVKVSISGVPVGDRLLKIDVPFVRLFINVAVMVGDVAVYTGHIEI